MNLLLYTSKKKRKNIKDFCIKANIQVKMTFTKENWKFLEVTKVWFGFMAHQPF